jgi:hypothetical protein
MKQYVIGYFVARLSVVLALVVLVLGLCGAMLSWHVFNGKIESARVPADAGLKAAVESINAAQRAAVEELRTAGLPVSRSELLQFSQFEGPESLTTLDRRLNLLIDGREIIVANQAEVVAKVGAGFDELIGQLKELARRTTAAVPPEEVEPAAPATDALLADAGNGVPPALYAESSDREVYRRRVQALDAAKVALLSLMTEVQKPENRDRIQSTMGELSNLERLISRAMQEEPDKPATEAEDDMALRTGAGRANHIASVLEKRKAGVVNAVLGDWAVLGRIDALARQLENRRQQIELSEIEISNLEFQRNIVSLGLVILAIVLAVVLGAAGDVARAILDCARSLGNM